jgi:hypothetical protein
MQHLASKLLVMPLLAYAQSASGMSEYYSHTRATMMIITAENGYIGANPAAPNYPGKQIYSLNLLSKLERHRFPKGKCISYFHFTFARLPAMDTGTRFYCNGVQFDVESCTGGRKSCETFVISARCNDFSNGKCHSSKARPDNGRPSYQYTYNVKRGVTSVNFAPGEGADAVLTLVRGEGFRL